MDHRTDTITTDDAAQTPARRSRRRITTVAVASVLAIGIGAGTAACASGSGGGTSHDQVAVANQAAAEQSDATGDAYNALSVSITTGMDLLASAEGKVSDTAAVDALSAALDKARAFNPTATYHDLDSVTEAQAKLQTLKTEAQQMDDAKATLDAAIKAVQDLTAG
jgi:hypothetical protein